MEDSRQEDGGAALWLGAALGALAKSGRDKLTLRNTSRFENLGLWLEQLIAESLGKEGRGILPIDDEYRLDEALYGNDRVFVFLNEGAHSSEDAAALVAAGQPVISIDAHNLGQLMYLFEFATAVAGFSLAVNPFDQPNVQEAKTITAAVLGEYLASGELPEVPEADDETLRALLDGTAPSYVAILGYYPYEPDSERIDLINELREAISKATGMATTFGHGPRFQHSTGQIHKGGKPEGRFLQLLTLQRSELAVPGAGYSFATLRDAQANGDLQALRARGLPAERIILGSDPADGIFNLMERIKRLLRK
jgi:hypothetical protein